ACRGRFDLAGGRPFVSPTAPRQFVRFWVLPQFFACREFDCACFADGFGFVRECSGAADFPGAVTVGAAPFTGRQSLSPRHDRFHFSWSYGMPASLDSQRNLIQTPP